MNKLSQMLRDRVGFTLVELMVVISIIGILLAIVSASFATARASARDKARMADLANLQQAFRLYAEENGVYPPFPGGVPIGVGATVDTAIASYFTTIPSDPLYGDTVHEYWYDSIFECDGVEYVVLMATEVERSGNSNFEEVCGVQALIYDSTDLTSNSLIRDFMNLAIKPKSAEAYSQASYYGQSSYVTACSFVSLVANPSSLPYGGGSTVLTWDGTTLVPSGTSGSVVLNPGNITQLSRDGSRTVNPTVTTTYVVSSDGGSYSSCSRSVTVTVNTTPPYSQGSYYSEAAYYNEGAYYSQASYAPENSGDSYPNSNNPDANGAYIILLN